MTPRGVQLHLGNAAQPRLVDTLVMSNLGYFQLKAAPGVFALRLAPGRSADLYAVDNSTDGAVAEDTAQARCSASVIHMLDLRLLTLGRSAEAYVMDSSTECTLAGGRRTGAWGDASCHQM